MVQVWEQPLKRRYLAPYFSPAYVFKFVSYAAWYIAPFFIAYASYCASTRPMRALFSCNRPL